ncbi:DoxX family membrane protein [Microlunatus parietis]|uniref:Putative membrane protein YphA (DoxX/SURF4 family)/rubrerythrin n=1 Tax=Microlunatus parietis TaxID=682979 RepID=A0A7Y9IEI4_9ACTN|nr:DoxX family membrane protein [Microlunatus parietis]NYE75320.1 putative membrane protein YphA (DoxX/SURF4 family)/rubrerythrin [Microlunatus parietis]
MTLLRAAARTLLASYFVVSGVKAVKDPDSLVPAAQPIADKVVPLVKDYAPDTVARYIPEDAATLIRINGALQLAGGFALATGKGRRLGALLLAASLVPSTIAKHPFWTRDNPEEEAVDKAHFLKNASLLGGVLLAAGDTEGKPSLAWRARRGSEALARDTKKSGRKAVKEGREFAEEALASGALLAGTVVAGSRRARKQAAKDLKKAREVAEKQAAEARKVAEKQAAEFKKNAERAAKDARKNFKKGRDNFAKSAEQARDDVAKQAGQVIKDVKKSDVAKKINKATENIHLGEN